MKYVSEFRNGELAKAVVQRIHRHKTPPARLMEFCGGHTVSIFKFGLRQVLPENLQLVSGPGCPVCVTATPDLDRAMAMARLPGVIITTFGDMFRVPASRGSLQQCKAEGADVRMVYSTLDALRIAQENPDRQVIFLGIGFETTAPTVAASLMEAEELGLENFFVYSMHKTTPLILRTILAAGDVNLQGLICPGHVSAIIGADAWAPIARDYGVPCVVSGFEPLDVLQCVDMIAAQLEEGRAEVEIAYSRGVSMSGNVHAVKLMEQVFEPGVANWRGVGEVPGSGLQLRPEYERFDAVKVFDVDPGPAIEPKGCICGEILRGEKSPLDCALFDSVCTPANPVGPCMVSSEGSCAAYHRYAR